MPKEGITCVQEAGITNSRLNMSIARGYNLQVVISVGYKCKMWGLQNTYVRQVKITPEPEVGIAMPEVATTYM